MTDKISNDILPIVQAVTAAVPQDNFLLMLNKYQPLRKIFDDRQTENSIEPVELTAEVAKRLTSVADLLPEASKEVSAQFTNISMTDAEIKKVQRYLKEAAKRVKEYPRPAELLGNINGIKASALKKAGLGS